MHSSNDWLMCISKKQFRTERQAERAIDRAVKDGRVRTGILRIYACPLCGHFHLTSKEKG